MNKIIFFTLISGICLSGCVRTEKIDNFPLEKPKIVVNCFLKNNQAIEFFISKSLSSIDNAAIKKISNAEIKIYENDNLVEVVAQESTNPTNSVDAYYKSTYKPKIGNYYKISVSAPKLPAVTAESGLPPELANVTAKLGKLDSTMYRLYQNNDTIYYINISKGTIILSIPDPANVKNYYKITLEAEERYWDGSNWNYRYRNVYLYNEEANYDNYSNGLFLNDKLYDGKNIPVILDIRYGYITTAKPKIKFKIIISSQSEEKQKYDISLGQYFQNQNNPFVEPTLVYSNILGGYGIFASESEIEIILD